MTPREDPLQPALVDPEKLVMYDARVFGSIKEVKDAFFRRCDLLLLPGEDMPTSEQFDRLMTYMRMVAIQRPRTEEDLIGVAVDMLLNDVLGEALGYLREANSPGHH